MAETVERLEISVTTPAGDLSTPVEIPAGFVPVTAIIPVVRGLGERALALEQRRAAEAGEQISCRQGCAACCRMLVPVSPPEALGLRVHVEGLPEDRQRTIRERLAAWRERMAQAGLLTRLQELLGTARQLTDEDMEGLNRDYYRLRVPCPFLEDERCTIYEQRPSACRELLVVSPAELCQDPIQNRVKALPVPLRITTALSLLWAELAGGPVRLIPLPLALEWAGSEAAGTARSWRGTHLLEKALDKVWRLLSEEFARGTPPS